VYSGHLRDKKLQNEQNRARPHIGFFEPADPRDMSLNHSKNAQIKHLKLI
jgi:hypothetical protein